MAVVQISRIQHRKGLLQDLPALASAELGWALDARRLYIGNGTIAEGAPVQGVTEILTQYSDILNISNNYTFRGSQTGYTSQTGLTALSPVQRSLQQKLDDFVDVRDFGAVGDGNADDTAAIQRAIDQIYFGSFALTISRLRRKIYFPAGTYRVSSSIKIPAYAYLFGDGRERSVISQFSATDPVMQFKDSTGNYGIGYGTGGGATVTNVTVEGITLFHNSPLLNVMQMDACDHVNFRNMLFKGSTSNSSYTGVSRQNAIYARPNNIPGSNPVTPVGNITDVELNDCEFQNCDTALVVNAVNWRMMGFKIIAMSQGLLVDTTATTAGTRNIKIIGGTFDSISNQAILVVAASSSVFPSVTSSMNYFGEVGNHYLGDSNPVTACITFAGSGNFSSGDYFVRSDAASATQARVSYPSQGRNVGLHANVGLTLGMVQIGSGKELLSLPASQTLANTGIMFSNTDSVGAVKLHYWLRRDSVPAYRSGVIDVVFNGSSVQYSDEYTEYPNATNFVYPGPTGVTFQVYGLSSTSANLTYTTDGSGVANLTYYITSIRQ